MTAIRTCSYSSSDLAQHKLRATQCACHPVERRCDLVLEARQHEFHPRFVSKNQDQNASRTDSGVILESKPIFTRTIRGLSTGALLGQRK